MKYRDVIEVVFAFFIAWAFYQGLVFVTGTDLPIVSVVSESMYHDSHYNEWWLNNRDFYEETGISQENFRKYTLANGMSKGDLLFVVNDEELEIGDIVIYQKPGSDFTIVHRLVKINGDDYIVKGDNGNTNSRPDPPVKRDQIKGKVIFGAPLLGYPRLALNVFGI